MNKMTLVAVAGLALAGCGKNDASISDSDLPKIEPWGETKSGESAHLITLKGQDGLTLVVSDFGGRLVKCFAPGRDGEMADVTLGWNTIPEYEKLGFSMGTLIGRYGNRIKDGKFTLDGTEYQLPVNEKRPEPRHCNLHGGPDGWDTKVWKFTGFVRNAEDGAGKVSGVEFALVSPDGDMGFPGTVTAKVRSSVFPGNVWRVEYSATTDKPTVLNLTHHSYWNLAGEASGNVLDQELKIYADEYTQTDAGLIPTVNTPVKGTGMDFTELRPIGAKADLMAAEPLFAPMDNWYDHNFVLRGKLGELHPAAEMFDPKSGRVLEVWTTEPCMQMYGAQNIGGKGSVPSKTEGVSLVKYAGMALETQHYPDSPNHPEFPSTVLRPGETFKSVTEYRFKTR